MQHFTIRDIENLCGIKAHTLRIWEQRYSFFVPERKEKGHRIYTNEDLKKLLRIAFLYHNGWKISKIAQLKDDAILTEVRNTEIELSNYNSYIIRILEAIIDFDKVAIAQQLNGLTKKIGFENCIIHICYPLLKRIGMLWVTNNIIPAQEHFCSYIIQHKIIAATDNLTPIPTKGFTVLLFCPHGEHHELPLFFLNYLLKRYGWNVIFLGSNIPMNVISQFTDASDVSHLFLHVITNFTGFALDDYFAELCTTFKDKSIIASGAAIFSLQRSFVNLTLLKSDQEIYDFIKGKAQALGNT
jgi:DNA-binding transcriptional MerR regulator